MLRAAQAAQDRGDERLEDQAEDDDQDKCQCIFHNLKLFFSLCFGHSGPGDAYVFLLLLSESCQRMASWRRRIRSRREEDCLSPLPAGLLDSQKASLDLQKGHTPIHGAAQTEDLLSVEKEKGLCTAIISTEQ